MSKKKQKEKITAEYVLQLARSEPPGRKFPEELLRRYSDTGFFFGLHPLQVPEVYVGIPDDFEGNVLVVGGVGSGKSTGIIKSTTKSFGGTFFVLDIKGELFRFYRKLEALGVVTRPHIVFDFENPNSFGYDFFHWVRIDDACNVASNIEAIAFALIPRSVESNSEFWCACERSVLCAALLYFFRKGLSFIQAVCLIADYNFSFLCEKLTSSDDLLVKNFIGDITEMKSEHLAAIERGLRNRLSVFISNPLFCNALRGDEGTGKALTWDKLETHNIFLHVPEDKLQQLAPILNLMLSQLLQHLIRRPDKYSIEGTDTTPVLLLLDEIAQLGKVDVLPYAIATLRSRKVNLCLAIQSLAQLDKFYGEKDRSIILDNCRYKAILNAGDPDTQEYLAKLIGTHKSIQRGCSWNFDSDFRCRSYGEQLNESRDWKIRPEDLAYLKDEIILISPSGVDIVKKFRGCEITDPFYLTPKKERAPVVSDEFACIQEQVSVPTVAEIVTVARTIASKSEPTTKRTTHKKKQTDCVSGQANRKTVGRADNSAEKTIATVEEMEE